MKRVCFILFCSGVTGLSAQKVVGERIDSLKDSLFSATKDTRIAELNYAISRLYADNNIDSALAYNTRALSIAVQSGFSMMEAQCRVLAGQIYNTLGDLPRSLTWLREGLQLAEKYNYDAIAANAYWYMGHLYNGIEDYSRTLELRRKNFAIKEKLKTDSWFISGFYLGHTFARLGITDSARYYTRLVKDSMIRNRTALNTTNFAGLAESYYLLKEYDSAVVYYRKTIPALRDEGSTRLVSLHSYGFAQVYRDMGAMDSARYYAQLCLDKAIETRFLRFQHSAGRLLAELWEKDDPSRALAFYKNAIFLKDSMQGTSSINALNAIEAQEKAAKRNLEKAQDRIRQISLTGAAGLFLVIASGLFYSVRRQRKNNRVLHDQKLELEQALQQLKATQSQLIQSEKMASLGELTAGIAHEIQNPLNFVNNFSEVNRELIGELMNNKDALTSNEQDVLLGDIDANLEKIVHHGKRADAIVKGMLHHSRTSSGQQEQTDVNALCDEYIRLAYHGLRAKDKSFNAKFETAFDASIEKINVVPQDIGRVILNLINNAFYAVNEKKKQRPDGYEPTVIVSTKKQNGKIEISVKDNGCGIPDSVKDKIFQPFFTTKPTGQGTGLGLSLSYDIVKAHGGEFLVESREGEGSRFTICIPATSGK